MPPSPAYLDECVDRNLVAVLRANGRPATSADAEDLVGVTDEEQLAYATGRGMLLLTHNGRHFWRLRQNAIRLGREHAGILALPGSARLPYPTRFEQLVIRVLIALAWLDDEKDHQSRFFRWHDMQRRLERVELPAGFTAVDRVLAQGRVEG